jgi:hypothetical protein
MEGLVEGLEVGPTLSFVHTVESNTERLIEGHPHGSDHDHLGELGL